MNWSVLISDIRETPKSVVFKKVWSAFRKLLRRPDSRLFDFRSDAPVITGSLFNPQRETFQSPAYDLLSAMYRHHRFDVLGSGWVKAGYGETVNGFFGKKFKADLIPEQVDPDGKWIEQINNPKHLIQAKACWEIIMTFNVSYKPIDWQRDLKSGYQFNGRWPYHRFRSFSPPPGVDFKLPWELARLQHLPLLMLNGESAADKKQNQDEVCCQLLDFILSNPPGHGVNWASAMDVAIRGANMAAVYDLLKKAGRLDNDLLESILRNSIWSHFCHVLSNLEHKDGLANNHYLSNLSGLMIMARLFGKSIREQISPMISVFLEETDRQFLTDGGNFESSIPYHFFSSEMVAYGLVGLQPFLTDEHMQAYQLVLSRMQRALDLMPWVVNDEGQLVQFGDNDSGRFYCWQPKVQIIEFKEAQQKYAHLVNSDWPDSYKNAFADIDQLNYNEVINLLKAVVSSPGEEASFFNHLVGEINHPAPTSGAAYDHHSVEGKPQTQLLHLDETRFVANGLNPSADLTENLTFKAFPLFGVYVFRSRLIHLVINGMNRHVKQYWPHGHNDKLSFDLMIGGKSIVADPGSLTYTPDAHLRNAYRSVTAHAVIQFGNEEQNTFLPGKAGVFRLRGETKVKWLVTHEHSITLELRYRQFVHRRTWEIRPNSVVVTDEANHPFKITLPSVPFSPGYGKQLKPVK